jgi:hypothetical protein
MKPLRMKIISMGNAEVGKVGVIQIYSQLIVAFLLQITLTLVIVTNH